MPRAASSASVNLGADISGVFPAEMLQGLQGIFLRLLTDPVGHHALGRAGKVDAVANQDASGCQQA